MTDINIAAIRARDAEMDYWQVTGGSAVCTDRRVLLKFVDALAAAARTVTCAECHGDGEIKIFTDEPDHPEGGRYSHTSHCPDCAELRRLLGEK